MPEAGANRLRLLLADDHPFVREGIRSFLADVPDIEIVGEAATGEEAVEMTASLRPDILLLDINLPGISGIEALRLIKSKVPGTKVLVLSVHNNKEYVIQGAKAGAQGYLLKDAPPEELLQALRAIQNGQRYYSASLAGSLASYFERASKPQGEPVLSPREIEVLTLIAQGKTIKEMAEALQVTPSTAQTYRGRMMEKLRIHTVAGLTKYALQKKLIPFE